MAPPSRAIERPISAPSSRNAGQAQFWPTNSNEGRIRSETVRDRIRSLRSGQIALKAKIQPEMREILLKSRPGSSSHLHAPIPHGHLEQQGQYGTRTKGPQLRVRPARTPSFGDAAMAVVNAAREEPPPPWHSSWMPGRPKSASHTDRQALIPYKPPRLQASDTSVRANAPAPPRGGAEVSADVAPGRRTTSTTSTPGPMTPPGGLLRPAGCSSHPGRRRPSGRTGGSPTPTSRSSTATAACCSKVPAPGPGGPWQALAPYRARTGPAPPGDAGDAGFRPPGASTWPAD